MNNLDYPIPVLELVTALKQLPGIGTRGAERMALRTRNPALFQQLSALVRAARH